MITLNPATAICSLFVLLTILTYGTFKAGAQSAIAKSIQVNRGADGQKIVYGKATHYSKSLEGSKTAIGTRYRNKKMTAASNFFKLRTWVRVTRLSNGRSIAVYINDRMHPAMARKGRVIDLSVAAAEELHFMGSTGITKVKVEQIPKPDQETEGAKDSTTNINQTAPESEISKYDR